MMESGEGLFFAGALDERRAGVVFCPLMLFDPNKRYVTPDEGRELFPDGMATWVDCANCGAPLLLATNQAPFCGGAPCQTLRAGA